MFKISSSILIISLLLGLVLCKESPDMIVVLSRHGAREPLNTGYDNSWANPTQITDVGIEEHYMLGKVLASKYSELLENITTDEMFLQSTYAERTQMSLSAQLYGLFSGNSHKHKAGQNKQDFKIPYANQTMINEIIDDIMDQSIIPNKLQFIPPKLHAKVEEDLIQISPHNCYYVEQRQAERFNDSTNQEMEKTYLKKTFAKLQRLGYDVKDMLEIKEFGDALISRESANLPPLKGLPYDGKLAKDSIFGFHWWNIYNVVGREYERSVKVFPLYSRMVEWFSGKAEGTNPLKLVLLGGHESSIFPFLNLYNITNHTCYTENYKSIEAGKPLPFPDCSFPEVASQLIWEYYSNAGSPYVRMLYNGKALKFCRDSEGAECSLDTLIAEFPEITSHLTPEKWQQICSKPPVTVIQSEFDLVLPTMMMIFGAIIGLISYLLISKKMVISHHQYAKGILEEPAESVKSPKSTAIETQMTFDNANQTEDDSAVAAAV